MMYRFLRFLAFLWLRIVYGLKGYGVENVPATGGAIIASNHSSFIDPMALGCVVKRPLTYIARGTLKGHWLYRWLTAKLDIVSIERDSNDRGQLRAVLEALEKGKACVIFPEGTRSIDGELKPFKGGVILLARLAKVPVVPAWVEGSFSAWSRHAKLPRFTGRVRTYYGKPLDLAGERDREAALSKLEQAIAQLDPRRSKPATVTDSAASR